MTQATLFAHTIPLPARPFDVDVGELYDQFLLSAVAVAGGARPGDHDKALDASVIEIAALCLEIYSRALKRVPEDRHDEFIDAFALDDVKAALVEFHESRLESDMEPSLVLVSLAKRGVYSNDVGKWGNRS